MSSASAAHPDSAQLAAFGLGQLDPTASAEVEGHVAGCTTCCQTLWTVPDDQLVALLRTSIGLPEEAAALANGNSFAKGEAMVALTFASEVPLPEHPQVTDPTAVGEDARRRAAPQIPAELAEHPRYRIQELLGVGGMGVVYKAEHRLMERPVALKVIDRALTSKPAVVERFRREVKAAARLTHPNIVHAYDAEQAGDTHFLVMEFVEGTNLARLVEQEGPLPVAVACDYIRQAALGLQRAWEDGMVHRDIKPQNLMLTPQGQVKILDFGLARLASETAPTKLIPTDGTPNPAAREVLTQLGMVMGTPDYIAPEQATDAHAADIRADIYSLGCTLYYLLAGQVPFPADTVYDKLMAHIKHTAKRLPDLRQDVPSQLARVIERMMAKDPAVRYQNPAEVAAALAPFIAAAPREPRRRVRYFIAAALLSAAALVAAAVIYVQTDKGEFVIETDDDNIAVMLNKAGGLKIEDRVSNRAYLLKVGAHDIRSGAYEIDTSELPDGVVFSAKTFTLKRGGERKVTVSIRPDAMPVVLKTFSPTDKPITQDGVTVDQKGWRIEAKQNRTVRLFEVANPGVEDCRITYRAQMKSSDLQGRAYLEMWCRLPGKGEFFSKGYANVVLGTTDWASYEIPFVLQKGQRPDLIKLNVTIEGKGTLWIKDIELVRSPLAPSNGWTTGLTQTNWAGLVPPLPQGGLLNPPAPGPFFPPAADDLRTLTGHTAAVISVAFSPDGKLALSGSDDHSARLWDLATGRELGRLESPRESTSAVFSPDGRTALTVSNDRTARLWDLASGKEIRHFGGQSPQEIWSAAFSPDGVWVLTGGPNSLRLWDVETGKELKSFKGGTSSFNKVAYSPDGRQALTASLKYQVRLWDLETGKLVLELMGHTDVVRSVAFSPNGRYGLSGGDDRSIRIWDLSTGKELRRIEGHTDAVWSVAFSPDGRFILSSSNDGAVCLWYVNTGRILYKNVQSTGAVYSAVFSPDGRRILFGGSDKLIHLQEVPQAVLPIPPGAKPKSGDAKPPE